MIRDGIPALVLLALMNATQPALHHSASLKVTLCGPPWRMSTRSATSAAATNTAKPPHSQGLENRPRSTLAPSM